MKTLKEKINSFNKNFIHPNSMIINLDGESIIKEIPAYQVKVTKIAINKIIDEPSNKRVLALTNIGEIKLWVNEEYDNIGQWTNDDVERRIKEIFNK